MLNINFIYDTITSPDTDKEFCVNSKIVLGTDIIVQLPLIDLFIKDDSNFNDFFQNPNDYSKSGGVDPSNFINKMKNDPTTANIPFGRYMMCATYHLNDFLVLVGQNTIHICNTTLKRTCQLDTQLIAFFSMIKDKMNRMRNAHGLKNLDMFVNTNDNTTKISYIKAFNKLYSSGYASPEFKNKYTSMKI